MTIVKKDSVKASEPRHLDGHVAAGAAGGPQATAEGQPQARVVQQDPAGAIVEVTCACGQTFLLNCRYAEEAAQ